MKIVSANKNQTNHDISDKAILQIKNISKSFTLHHQGSASFKAFENISLTVSAGQCVVLQGESGVGKSTLLRCLYANYLTDSGSIYLNDNNQQYDLSNISERLMIKIRHQKIAYVSQFLRVIPRVPAFEIVMQPLLELGYDKNKSEQRVSELLTRLNIPQRLWSLSPTTFSGGEQQRINIAREFAVTRPVMLLDEPTASLDAGNRQTVIHLIQQAKANKSAIVGIFHDQQSRDQVADQLFDIKTGVFV